MLTKLYFVHSEYMTCTFYSNKRYSPSVKKTNKNKIMQNMFTVSDFMFLLFVTMRITLVSLLKLRT